MQSVNSLVQGLEQVKTEITALRTVRNPLANDQFVHFMQVRQRSGGFHFRSST